MFAAILRRCLYVFLSLHFIACGVPHDSSQDAPVILPRTKAIILVPGFKGSVLSDAQTKDTVWIDLSNALWGNKSLAISLPDISLKKPGREVFVDGVLDTIPILWGLFSYNAYGNAIRKIEAIDFDDTQLYTFAYDWRRDLSESAKELSKFVTQVHANGQNDITLIGHSMGGLIAAYYIRYGDQTLETSKENWEGAARVNRVVFSGTPFRGAATIFNDMQQGINAGINSSLLSSEALSTFPACYQLLPGVNEITLVDEKNNPLPHVMHDGNAWSKNGWGLLRESEDLSSEEIVKRTEYTKRELDRAALFSKKITDDTVEAKLFHHIPILNLAGKGKDTIAKIHVSAEQKRELFYDDGDSVVPITSSRLPKAFYELGDVDEKELVADHGSILSSDESVGAIKEFLGSK